MSVVWLIVVTIYVLAKLVKIRLSKREILTDVQDYWGVLARLGYASLENGMVYPRTIASDEKWFLEPLSRESYR